VVYRRREGSASNSITVTPAAAAAAKNYPNDEAKPSESSNPASTPTNTHTANVQPTYSKTFKYSTMNAAPRLSDSSTTGSSSSSSKPTGGATTSNQRGHKPCEQSDDPLHLNQSIRINMTLMPQNPLHLL